MQIQNNTIYYATIRYLHYTTPITLHYTNMTITYYNYYSCSYNSNCNYSTLHYTNFRPSVDSLCHPCITTTHPYLVSYL